ncbi:MAG: NINE protein [Planctomycetota bacterium]|nr:NINE protein [Planctomycetota bacterium]
MSSSGTGQIYCYACSAPIDSRAEICPKCGVRQRQAGTSTSPEIREAASKKLAAGLCGLLLGAFGVHKFILGMTGPGIIMLLITVCTLFFGSIITGTIGLIEGIIYLTKSDEEFYQTYIVEKKSWF